jgi:aspartyl-tRNA synthetase
LFHERIFCGQVTEADVGRPLLLAGWVDAFRDHGGLLFIHLRDRSGILQVVISPEVAPPEVCALAATLRAEFCIAVRGALVRRQAGTETPTSRPARSS